MITKPKSKSQICGITLLNWTELKKQKRKKLIHKTKEMPMEQKENIYRQNMNRKNSWRWKKNKREKDKHLFERRKEREEGKNKERQTEDKAQIEGNEKDR